MKSEVRVVLDNVIQIIQIPACVQGFKKFMFNRHLSFTTMSLKSSLVGYVIYCA
jgi:hypothetical protein